MNKVPKAHSHLNGPDKPNPVIACPACGASIPIADALGQAMAEQAAEAERATINWKQQETKLRSELAKAVRAREGADVQALFLDGLSCTLGLGLNPDQGFNLS
jgi:hypothetical protein